jgi:hypothetical protein
MSFQGDSCVDDFVEVVVRSQTRPESLCVGFGLGQINPTPATRCFVCQILSFRSLQFLSRDVLTPFPHSDRRPIPYTPATQLRTNQSPKDTCKGRFEVAGRLLSDTSRMSIRAPWNFKFYSRHLESLIAHRVPLFHTVRTSPT